MLRMLSVKSMIARSWSTANATHRTGVIKRQSHSMTRRQPVGHHARQRDKTQPRNLTEQGISRRKRVENASQTCEVHHVKEVKRSRLIRVAVGTNGGEVDTAEWPHGDRQMKFVSALCKPLCSKPPQEVESYRLGYGYPRGTVSLRDTIVEATLSFDVSRVELR
jgi:hypothetical protein